MSAQRGLSLRRRADNAWLRWQARVDSPWVERFLPWLIAAVLLVVLATLALATSGEADESGRFAAALQASWLISEGQDPTLTVSYDSHFLAQQLALAMYPVAWATRVLPTFATLVVLQSAALAVAVVPLWHLARRAASLRVAPTAVLVGVYALYPSVHNLNVAGFATEAFALPALLAAAYAGLTDRCRWFWVFALVVVTARADLGLAVAGLGLSLWLVGRARLGRQALVAGTAWALLAALVIQPWFGDGVSAHLEAFEAFGSSVPGVMWGMLTQPGDVASAIAQERGIDLFIILLGPVIFLPLLAPRLLVGVLPLQVLYLIGETPPAALFGEQTVAATAFIFLALAFALSRMGRMGLQKVTVDPRLLVALLVAGAACFVSDASSSPYREPWAWGPGGRADARSQAAELVGPDDRVVASPSMLTPLAQRTEIRRVEAEAEPDAGALGSDADVVVIDARQHPEWGPVEHRVLALGLEQLGFQEAHSREDIHVWRRD